MEETITIEKTYTKKEAFQRFIQIYGKQTATEAKDEESEYNKLIVFLGFSEFI